MDTMLLSQVVHGGSGSWLYEQNLLVRHGEICWKCPVWNWENLFDPITGSVSHSNKGFVWEVS